MDDRIRLSPESLELESEIISTIQILNKEEPEIRKDVKIRNVVKLSQVPVVLNVLGLTPTMAEVKQDSILYMYPFLMTEHWQTIVV